MPRFVPGGTDLLRVLLRAQGRICQISVLCVILKQVSHSGPCIFMSSLIAPIFVKWRQKSKPPLATTSWTFSRCAFAYHPYYFNCFCQRSKGGGLHGRLSSRQYLFRAGNIAVRQGFYRLLTQPRCAGGVAHHPCQIGLAATACRLSAKSSIADRTTVHCRPSTKNSNSSSSAMASSNSGFSTERIASSIRSCRSTISSLSSSCA
jgi:hypothetical protein